MTQAVAAFLEQFDSYEAARQQLRQAEEGSDDERYCITNCADLWKRLVEARAGIAS